MTEAIDREKKIAEIREALEKASPGPWMFGNFVEGRRLILGSNIKYVASVQIHQTPRMYGIHDEVEREANAHLIANAPEWLGFLLDELERLEREYAEERAAHNYALESNITLVEKDN